MWADADLRAQGSKVRPGGHIAIKYLEKGSQLISRIICLIQSIQKSVISSLLAPRPHRTCIPVVGVAAFMKDRIRANWLGSKNMTHKNTQSEVEVAQGAFEDAEGFKIVRVV